MKISVLSKLLFITLLLGSVHAQAQIYKSVRVIHLEDASKMSTIEKMEDTLVFLSDSMQLSPLPEARIEGSYAFIKVFKRFLQMKNSYEFPLEKLSKKIAIVQPEDKAFKIYTWDVVRSNTQLRYYGALHLADGSFQPLIDASDQIIRGAADSTFFNMRWYGAEYYNVVQKKIGTQNAYFLFGYNGNSVDGDKKIVEPFGFDRQGRAIFGAPVFRVKGEKGLQTNMRFILEYQKQARVSLNYDKEKDFIIYDHCESSVGDYKKKNTYVPDGTYDGLQWDGRYWTQKTNVIQIQALPAGQVPVVKPINK